LVEVEIELEAKLAKGDIGIKSKNSRLPFLCYL
jgi:hypothetical protein